MSAVPILQDEINRKSVETLEWLINAYTKAKISEAQLSTGLDALSMAIVGLTHQKAFKLIAAASSLITNEKDVAKRCFAKFDQTATLRWIADEDFIEVVAYVRGDEIDRKKKVYASPVEAREKMKNAGDKLLTLGYIEL